MDQGSPAGPSTDSAEQHERIQARRQRIQARMEAERRGPFVLFLANLTCNSGSVVENVVEKPKIDPKPHQSIAQVKASKQAIESLREKGADKVTLVRVTADFTESKTRQERDDERDRLHRQVLEEQSKSQALFDEISKRWDSAADKTDHADIKAELDALNAECQTVVSSKDAVIETLKGTLKERDEAYVKGLRAHTSDVDTALRYMEEQTQSMVKEYHDQIEEIERTFMTERADLIKSARKEWDSYMERRRKEELEFIEGDMAEEHINQLDHLRTADAEEYHHVKVKLETELQNLEQQLQTMKATLQLNSEKLDYNFQVLKKRDEENMIMLTQQKRRINRLQDVLNGLKAKILKAERQYTDDNASLTEDYTRIAEQFKDLQKKFRHFQALDAKRYDEVFEMSEEKNVELAQRLLDADRVIFEQQLGLKWIPPTADAFDSSAEAGRRAAAAAERRAEEIGKDVMLGDDAVGPAVVSNDTIRRVLELLCDEAGFLLEERIGSLLGPLHKNEQSLVKLDAIFKALGIEDEADIIRLAKYFVKPGSEEQELVDPNDAIEALKKFAEDHRRIKGIDKPEKLASGKNRRPDFWKQLQEVVPQSHDDAWNALLDGLEKYSAALQGRQKAIETTESLRQQNAELRTLLHQYMGSQINSELAIPPTTVLGLQVAQAQAQAEY